MEWVLRSPQIHNTFSNLGFATSDGYHINENCNAALESILKNILAEDKHLRTYRRSISFGQNISKDLIPLLLNTKDDTTIELLIKILVNLTIPVECLLSVDTVIKTDIGRHAIFEINNLLTTTKIAITDERVCKVVIDFLKKNANIDQQSKLNVEQCMNISNTLLFLRNVLHIPEAVNCHIPTFANPPHRIQNQLLWNLFSQSIDKVLINLMTIPDAINWGVTMVQLIALIYKDQHVTTLHKLLNVWLETALSDSSEDNESNTSSRNRGSHRSSPSDPTSDSSNTGSGKINGEHNSFNNDWDSCYRNDADSREQSFQSQNKNDTASDDISENSDAKIYNNSEHVGQFKVNNEIVGKTENKTVNFDTTGFGFDTQVKNLGSLSTSSNDDDFPAKKPVHRRPHPLKKRAKKKSATVSLQERIKKKIVKRCKANILNVQGLTKNMPTDYDISKVLKEFTVDFLTKGYNSLVRTLHTQILTNMQLEIDTSHFFWLITYFLKFATQIELDLNQICSVLSFDIISYLTAEGVNLCEELELTIKLNKNDLKPSIRRLHLVVTAIREFIQAIEVNTTSNHNNQTNNDKDALVNLQIRVCDIEELRSLFVLLLRQYNPTYHSKQYLQDLIVTNHILLTFLDDVMKLPEYKGGSKIVEYVRQFSSPEIMYQYGLLLEDYQLNGEFINECIFTLMHHVAGEVGCLISLFQPKILKIFTLILRSEFEICEDWSDLIAYVINTFVRKPYKMQSSRIAYLEKRILEGDEHLKELLFSTGELNEEEQKKTGPFSSENNRWTEEELSSLSWNYMQCNNSADVIGDIIKLFKDDGIIKSRNSVAKELYTQFLINKAEFENFLNNDSSKSPDNILPPETKENENGAQEDEIGKLCDQLRKDGMYKFLDWVQIVLLDACYSKIYTEKTAKKIVCPSTETMMDPHSTENDSFMKQPTDLPMMSPLSYHSLLMNKSIPLVPWTSQQGSICKDLKFLQLLHKLGFQMPVDTGKVYIRIPNFWTPDVLYEVASKISPIDVSKLKFSLSDISQTIKVNSAEYNFVPEIPTIAILTPTPENFFQKHNIKQNQSTIMNLTPKSESTTSGDEVNINKPGWLDIVQKSQKYKLNLNFTKSVPPPVEDAVKARPPSAAPLGPRAPPAPPPPAAADITPQIDPEYYNNSVCETASVASDLTRMYVSDEDEKPEPLRPRTKAPDRDADDHGLAGKRPRYLPPFGTDSCT